MTYKLINKFKVFALFLGAAAFITSCVDEDTVEFVAPTGNVNNVQPNSLFTTSVNPTDNLGVIFRSFSTDAVSYLWDFGDGNTSAEENPNYTYTEGGEFNVQLTTTSSDNLEATATGTVAPVFADFNVAAPVDTQVTFENLSSGAMSLIWDFGDGETAEWTAEDTELDEDFSPVHTYLTADDFDATLTVTSFSGAQVVVTKAVTGLVLSTIPDFTFSSNMLTAEFTDASFEAVSYLWDFGDGVGTSTMASPTYTYAVDGTYEVTLTTANSAGETRSISQFVPVGGITATFKAIVLNPTMDEFTVNTGDNADAFDMTPNSTIQDNTGATVDSPFRPLWRNTDLNDWIDANTGCTNEQPSSTSSGNNGTRGLKLSDPCRRLYQVVQVEVGVEYQINVETRSEAEGSSSELFILNEEITTEVGIESFTTASVLIDNDFNSSSSEFTTTSLFFTPTTTSIVIYMRSPGASGATEIFVDNLDIVTPGF